LSEELTLVGAQRKQLTPAKIVPGFEASHFTHLCFVVTGIRIAFCYLSHTLQNELDAFAQNSARGLDSVLNVYNLKPALRLLIEYKTPIAEDLKVCLPLSSSGFM